MDLKQITEKWNGLINEKSEDNKIKPIENKKIARATAIMLENE